MDLRKLKTLIELVESSGIAELEIAEGEERVRITRSFPHAASAVTASLGANDDRIRVDGCCARDTAPA